MHSDRDRHRPARGLHPRAHSQEACNIKKVYPWAQNPRKNVWLGTTAENQRWADLRVERLIAVDSHVRFLSCEPILSAINLERWLAPQQIGWVIAGGESGQGGAPDPSELGAIIAGSVLTQSSDPVKLVPRDIRGPSCCVLGKSPKEDISDMSVIEDLSALRDYTTVSSMRDSPIHNVERLGYLVRLKRQEKGMSQAALAAQLGVERKWVLKLEAGNGGAELALVLKVLGALGLHVIIREQAAAAPPSELDAVFRRLERTDK